jgi:hypothetical protein
MKAILLTVLSVTLATVALGQDLTDQAIAVLAEQDAQDWSAHVKPSSVAPDELRKIGRQKATDIPPIAGVYALYKDGDCAQLPAIVG